MASSYPASFDVFADPIASTPMNDSSRAHAALHVKLADAIEALQSTIGMNPQGAHANVVTRLNATAPLIHSHAVADVTGLQAALDGKAASGHTHTIANVSGLQAALDGKSSLGNTTPAALGVAAVGSASTAARSDHVHALPTLSALGAASSGISITAGSGLTGGGTLAATRTLSANLTSAGGDNGSATTVARGDHLHDGRYYTEAESDSRFASASHNHDGTYAKVVYQSSGTAMPSASSYPSGTILAVYA